MIAMSSEKTVWKHAPELRLTDVLVESRHHSQEAFEALENTLPDCTREVDSLEGDRERLEESVGRLA